MTNIPLDMLDCDCPLKRQNVFFRWDSEVLNISQTELSPGLMLMKIILLYQNLVLINLFFKLNKIKLLQINTVTYERRKKLKKKS